MFKVAAIGLMAMTTVAAPEIGATSAAAGVALLLGGLAVLRGRKARL